MKLASRHELVNSDIDNWFYDNLPTNPHCTDDLKYGTSIYPKAIAARHKYLQLNRKYRSILAFDIDREGAAFAFEEHDLPQPTITTINPANAHAHLLYGLETPVSFLDRNGQGSAREKPMKYFLAVERALRNRLRADQNYTGFLTKNPLWDADFCGPWVTIQNPKLFTLSDLAEHLELSNGKYAALPVPRHEEFSIGCRNRGVFDIGRILAYSSVKHFSDAQTFNEHRFSRDG